MSDNAKETNQNPIATETNADDNRRRTRSQTRTGGMTPPAPVLESRGRKRSLPTPTSGAKRGRKPAQKPASVETDEHSKKTEDLSKNADIKDVNKDESVEMQVDTNNEQDLKSNNGEIQKVELQKDACTPKKKKDESADSKKVKSSKAEETPKAEGKLEVEPEACALPNKEKKGDEAKAEEPSAEAKEVNHDSEEKVCPSKEDEQNVEKQEKPDDEANKSESKEKELSNDLINDSVCSKKQNSEAPKSKDLSNESNVVSNQKGTDDEDVCTIKEKQSVEPVKNEEIEKVTDSATCDKADDNLKSKKPESIKNDICLGGEVVKND